MTPVPSARDFLMAGGVPTAKFPNIGSKVEGTVADDPQVRQQKDLKGNLQYWDDGNPKYMLVINIKTNERDPNNANDDGVRALFVASVNMQQVIREAVRVAGGENGVERGGYLSVQYVSDGQSSGPGYDPPKQYVAVYRNPSSVQSAQFLNNVPTTQVQTAPQGNYPTTQVNPAPQPEQQQIPAAPQQPALTPELLAALQQIGVDPAKLGQQQ